MSTDHRATARGVVFRVLDGLDAPHGGRILRLRLQSGEAPSIRGLRDARLHAVSPQGRESYLRIVGFAVFGGKPSDERLRRTGRLDVLVEPEDGQEPVSARWEVTLA